MRRGAASSAASPARASRRPPAARRTSRRVDADGNAASLSTSTGSGSGVIVPGTGIYLNNMLGEYDLVGGRRRAPGRRLTSMMAPTIVLAPDGSPRLVVGSAGSARLRGAIMQIVVNVVEHGMAVERGDHAPRVHVDEPHVHCEGGHDPAELDRLEAMGYDVVALAAAQPLLRRRCGRRGRSRDGTLRPRATRGGAGPGVVVEHERRRVRPREPGDAAGAGRRSRARSRPSRRAGCSAIELAQRRRRAA